MIQKQGSPQNSIPTYFFYFIPFFVVFVIVKPVHFGYNINYKMEERRFELVSKFKPTGDQPQAIESLVEGLNDGLRTQVLLGVTGSGKTFTMANIIEKVQRPTLVKRSLA